MWMKRQTPKLAAGVMNGVETRPIQRFSVRFEEAAEWAASWATVKKR